jgi:3-phosphoshikimate 1-carboxyvinyltransferase
MTSNLPNALFIGPSGPLGGYVRAPASKNYTTRFILAAALAAGRSQVRRPADNDDARALIRCCRALGAKIAEERDLLAIDGVAGRPINPGVLNPGNAGAVLRLLLGAACLVEGEVRFETDFSDSLGRRPNRELLDALQGLGAETTARDAEGRLPITIAGGRGRVRGGSVELDASRSSQFLSSLLFLAPHLEGETTIRIARPELPVERRLVSAPPIDQTLDALERFGARIERSADGMTFAIDGGRSLRAADVEVGGDWPSAAALMAAVAVAGGMACIRGLREDAQGERRIGPALEAMGCRITGERDELYIHGKGELRAIEFNGDLATDAVLALEAAACLAEGTTRITGIGNLAIKESNRIDEPLEELAKLGVVARRGEDWIEIDGRPEGYAGGIEVDCRGDHRIAQMLAIVATRCEKGLILRGADCVSKSYPAFFDDMARLGVKIARVAAPSGAAIG